MPQTLTRCLVLLVMTVLAVPLLSLEAHAATAVERAYGDDRITTAIAASRQTHDQAAYALLATATTFPDALAAAALANQLGAPLLLTPPDALPEAVAEEVTRLGVHTVSILGGPSAVAPAVADRLAALGLTVERLAGETRYATAAAIARRVGLGNSDEVVIALGDHPDPARAWADAVAASALAATPDQVPTLLTRPGALPSETVSALHELDPSRVLLLGGENVIAPGVAEHLVSMGYPVERIAGTTRYGTSAALAEDSLSRFDVEKQPVVFASGGDFPDALAAGSVAAALDAPLVLVAPEHLTEVTDEFLRAHSERWTRGIVIGGPAATDPFVVEQLDAALRDAPPPAPPERVQTASGADEKTAAADKVVDTFSGNASWYGPGFAGRRTASGEIFDPQKLTAAHRSLPFGTRVRVTNPDNGRQVVVRINDRGPYHDNRVLDVSSAAADALGMKSAGTAFVRCEILAG